MAVPSIIKRSSSESQLKRFPNQQTYNISDFIAASPSPQTFSDPDENSEDAEEWSSDFKYTYSGERIMPKCEAHPKFNSTALSPLQSEEKIPEYIDRWKADPHTVNPCWPAPDVRKNSNWISTDEQLRREAWRRYLLYFYSKG